MDTRFWFERQKERQPAAEPAPTAPSPMEQLGVYDPPPPMSFREAEAREGSLRRQLDQAKVRAQDLRQAYRDLSDEVLELRRFDGNELNYTARAEATEAQLPGIRAEIAEADQQVAELTEAVRQAEAQRLETPAPPTPVRDVVVTPKTAERTQTPVERLIQGEKE